MRAITSPRLRALVRRLVGRGLELRLSIETDAGLRKELGAEVELLLDGALELARRASELEDGLTGLDAGEIYEQLQSIDERIAAATEVNDTAALIDTKVELRQRLQQADEQQHALVLATSRLLDLLSRLTTLHAEVRARQSDDDRVASLSVILRDLSAELDAHRELDQLLPGNTQVPDVDAALR